MGPIDGVWTDAMAIHIGQDIADPPAVFLPALKQQQHGSVDGLPVGGKDFSGSQQHGDVAVVATGVHHPVLLALADPGLG